MVIQPDCALFFIRRNGGPRNLQEAEKQGILSFFRFLLVADRWGWYTDSDDTEEKCVLLALILTEILLTVAIAAEPGDMGQGMAEIEHSFVQRRFSHPFRGKRNGRKRPGIRQYFNI